MKRDISSWSNDWETMPTQQLDELLHIELQKDVPDEKTVLQILSVLEERENGRPTEIGVQEESAWETYQQETAKQTKKARSRIRTWMIRGTAIAAVLGLILMAVPQAVEADGFFGKVVRWAERVFETIVPTNTQPEYVFRSDNQDLQMLYDKVAELGATQPVVPMWIPEDLALDDIKNTQSSAKERIYARFSNGEQWLVYTVDIYQAEKKSNYAKDDEQFCKFEISGITHYILSNEGFWSAIWMVDNLECTIATNSPEDVLYQILYSVYDMEVL